MHPLLHTVLKTDQPEVAHIQGLLATSTEHKLFLVRSQGCVPGAKTSQAKNHQTLKCKERNNWIDDSVTETQVCNNVRIEHRKTHFLFLNLIMHWVTTPTPTSIVLIDYVGAGLAKNEPRARLPSPPPALSSQKQIHKGFSFRSNKNRPALQISLGSAQVSHQLLHSGCSMLVLPSPVCLRYVVTLAPVVALCCRRVGYFAVHTQHTLKNLSNSGHKHLSDLIFHNYDHWTIKRALCETGMGTT